MKVRYRQGENPRSVHIAHPARLTHRFQAFETVPIVVMAMLVDEVGILYGIDHRKIAPTDPVERPASCCWPVRLTPCARPTPRPGS